VRRPDTSLARRRLGWCQAITLEAGLARTIEWFATRGVGSGSSMNPVQPGTLTG
jgi:dTDP-glucose 4,6-dehydratase